MTTVSAPTSPTDLSLTTMPLPVLAQRPATTSGDLTCTERLPRDVLVRLVALSHQIGDIRQGHAEDPDLSLRLSGVTADVDVLIQSIYDDTVRHLTGRHG